MCFGCLGVHAEGNAEGKVEGNAGGNAEGNAKGSAKGNAEGNAGGFFKPLFVGPGSCDFRFLVFFFYKNGIWNIESVYFKA